LSRPGLVQVPRGVQCFVGDEARRRREIEARVLGVFRGWDYEEIIPPLYDYAEVFSDPELQTSTLSFVGRDAELLALRSDFTSLLAKIAAGRLAHREPPIRLYYSGEVLRDEPLQPGRQSELYQMGLEHLGGDSRAADAELLAIAAECLESLGIEDWVLAGGHVGVFGGLLGRCALDAAGRSALRDRVDSRDPTGVRELLAGGDTPAPVAAALEGLTGLAGGVDTLPAALSAVECSPEARAAVKELEAVAGAAVEAGLGARLVVDLSEVRGFGYYTGLVLRAYAPGLGFDLGRGGRYDGLLARFGRPLPAVGLMFGLDRLSLVLERQGRMPETDADGPAAVASDTLGAGLRDARARRARGERIRFGNGGGR
jgi:ATP phosphoribosyltransferase regulatory subunit